MSHTQLTKKWIYTGPDYGIDFDEIEIVNDPKFAIPDSQKPTPEMQDRFRQNCADMGFAEFVYE